MATKYSSTRGGQTGMSFEDVVLCGLARDRGLFVPESIPRFSAAEIDSMKDKSFEDIALATMSKFISSEEIPRADLERLIGNSTVNFRHDEVTPVIKLGKEEKGLYLLELFHGPTFAFKDVALQFLGNLFEYFLLRKKDQDSARLTILGATSGDTGSAAIHGLRGKKNIDCFILYPHNRVSEIQERQMTTVPDKNIHCMAVTGSNFDDCQALVKASFNDTSFRDKVKLGAVNSINWARVLAQISYYFYAYYRCLPKLPRNQRKVSFSVPTGNFGDILAGYYAREMGLPIGDLVVATNENDILDRFFRSGKYERALPTPENMGGVIPTISPSMDICVSSNFERYLFHLCGNNAEKLRGWMDAFEGRTPAAVSSAAGVVISGEDRAHKGCIDVGSVFYGQARKDFKSYAILMDENLRTMRHYATTADKDEAYILCPHASIGVAAGRRYLQDVRAGGGDGSTPAPPVICLATAHHGKFPDAVEKALLVDLDTKGGNEEMKNRGKGSGGKTVIPVPPPPPELGRLFDLPVRRALVEADLGAVQSFVDTNRTTYGKPTTSSSSSSSGGGASSGGGGGCCGGGGSSKKGAPPSRPSCCGSGGSGGGSSECCGPAILKAGVSAVAVLAGLGALAYALGCFDKASSSRGSAGKKK